MSTPTNPKSHILQETADQALADGLSKHGQALGTMLIGGKPYQPSDVATLLQSRITASKAVAPARSVWLEAASSYRSELTTTKPVIAGVRQVVLAAFANAPATLADFGLSAPKKSAVTPATRVVAAAKAKATREARGTLGSAQKQAITGNVTGVRITPVTAPVAASPVAGSPPIAPNGTPAGSPAAMK